ncbi:DMT family transporter [Desulfomicrobium orale]|uniref:DMT family transporter n=1 Tax=Desulfomicrobium orale TaxID=132132 RepID=UPI0009F92AC1|nr:DMT family transporter [Desulfomicrobium orale]
MNKSSIAPFMALLTAMMLWGSSFVAFKYVVMVFDPVVVVFARMVLASSLLLLVLRWWRPRVIHLKDIPVMLFMALCEPCLYFILEGQALTLTTASQAGMVAATLPVLVALCSVFFLGERLEGKVWAGLFLALAGVVWVSLCASATETAPRPVLGNFLELLAMMCAAGYTISMKKLCGSYSPCFLTAVQFLVGTVFFFPLLFLPGTELPRNLTPGPVWAVVYLGTCVSVGAYGLYNFGISRLPAWQASAFINLVPVFSILLGWAWLDERLSLLQLLGACAVFGGVLMSQRWDHQTQKEEPFAGNLSPVRVEREGNRSR